MARINDLQLGGFEDTVMLRLGGDEVKIAEHYEIKVSVLQQPAAFTLRLGWGETASALLEKYPPGTPFELFIGKAQDADGNKSRSQIQAGTIYSRGAPSGNFTQVELKGRDYLARLFDDEVAADVSFSEKTYFALTRKVLDIVGLQERSDETGAQFILYASNDDNRTVVSRVKDAKPKKKGEVVVQVETGATAGAGKVVYQTLKTKVGTRWYDFLQQQYKLAGLFLWSTGEGNFVLTQPRADQEPSFAVRRFRNKNADLGDVVEARYQDDVTNRHAAVRVFGRGGSGTGGRKGIEGYWADPEMKAYGFTNTRTIFDDDIKSDREAEYLARKTIAEERRAGWQLEYTLSGHLAPSLANKDAVGVWCPDMVCRVDDDELNLHGNYYIEHVTFTRGPETTTTITLMRPEDLLFADGLFDEAPGQGTGTAKPKKPPHNPTFAGGGGRFRGGGASGSLDTPIDSPGNRGGFGGTGASGSF